MVPRHCTCVMAGTSSVVRRLEPVFLQETGGVQKQVVNLLVKLFSIWLQPAQLNEFGDGIHICLHTIFAILPEKKKIEHIHQCQELFG